jgi:hypothetical protein
VNPEEEANAAVRTTAHRTTAHRPSHEISRIRLQPGLFPQFARRMLPEHAFPQRPHEISRIRPQPGLLPQLARRMLPEHAFPQRLPGSDGSIDPPGNTHCSAPDPAPAAVRPSGIPTGVG